MHVNTEREGTNWMEQGREKMSGKVDSMVEGERIKKEKLNRMRKGRNGMGGNRVETADRTGLGRIERGANQEGKKKEACRSTGRGKKREGRSSKQPIEKRGICMHTSNH